MELALPRRHGSSKLTAVKRFDAEFSADLVRREMEKMLATRTFRVASAQRNFLRYVITETIEGRGELLKEYSIGVAVFHKRESFDPRVDSKGG